MKIDRTKLKKSSSEVPPNCKALIDKLNSSQNEEFLKELEKETWNCEESDLYHWIDILDKFDAILENSSEKSKYEWSLKCDSSLWIERKRLLLSVLQFTALLIEHSVSLYLYNSMEHVIALLSSSDLNIVIAVLNLLYVFSKKSKFMMKLKPEKRMNFLLNLSYLAESWGGKKNGFGLAECCQNLPMTAYPPSASTLHFQYCAGTSGAVVTICIANIDKLYHKSPSEITEDILKVYAVPKDKQMQLFIHVRLAHYFSHYPKRILCIVARLQALSVLVYCNAVPENSSSLLYSSIIEEFIDVIKLQDNSIVELQATVLRALTSIVYMKCDDRLSIVIDTAGAASYDGFLPTIIRSCIQALTDSEAVSRTFVNELFLFLYHLASSAVGKEALTASRIIEALLEVINWHSTETEHITFVTRVIYTIDLITDVDMQEFFKHGGLASFIQRLEMEVNVCKKDQPFVINPKLVPSSVAESQNARPSGSPCSSIDIQASMEADSLSPDNRRLDADDKPELVLCSTCVQFEIIPRHNESKKGLQCFPPRAILLKSMLHVVKKCIQDSVFSDSIQNLMFGTFPQSLKHILSNREYYGMSLFLLDITLNVMTPAV